LKDAITVGRFILVTSQLMEQEPHGTIWGTCALKIPLKGQDIQKNNKGTPKQPFSIDAWCKALADMVIIDEMPFRIVSRDIPKCYSPGFNHLLES